MLDATDGMLLEPAKNPHKEKSLAPLNYFKQILTSSLSPRKIAEAPPGEPIEESTAPLTQRNPPEAPIDITRKSIELEKSAVFNDLSEDNGGIAGILSAVQKKRSSISKKRRSITSSIINTINFEFLQPFSASSTERMELSADNEKLAQLFYARDLATFLDVFKNTSDEEISDYLCKNGYKDGVRLLKFFKKQIDHQKAEDVVSELIDLENKKFKGILEAAGFFATISQGDSSEQQFVLPYFYKILTANLDQVLGEEQNFKKLAEMLCALCMQINAKRFDGEKIRHITIGLMSEFPSLVMLKILYKLLRVLNPDHKVLALYIIKEMILWDEFDQIYQEEQLISECPIENQEIICIFAKIASYKRSDEFTLHHTSQRINIILANTYKKMGAKVGDTLRTESESALDYLSKVAKRSELSRVSFITNRTEKLAKCLRASTLLLYQTLNLREFTKEQKNETEKHNIEHIKNFNTLSQYIAADIVGQIRKSDCISRYTYYISTLEALLTHKIPDIHSASIVLAGLTNVAVERLNFLLTGVNEDVRRKFESLKNILSPRLNFTEQRKIMLNSFCCLPYMGLYSKDLTFAQENNEMSKYEVIGKIYGDLIQRQHALRKVSLTVSDYIYTICSSWNMKSDEEMKCLSQHHTKKPINLDSETTLEGVNNVLDFFLHHQDLALVFSYQGKVGTPEDPVAPLFSWLENFFDESTTSQTVEMFKRAMLYFGKEKIQSYQNRFSKEQQKRKHLTLQFDTQRLGASTTATAADSSIVHELNKLAVNNTGDKVKAVGVATRFRQRMSV